jgi:hypothetical protein
MTFIHAIPLGLFALAAIPLVLHLLTLQRLRTVELPTYRFLFDSYVQQRRRTQFLEALLAMLRMLFILGLVILIARPVVTKVSNLFQSGGGRDVIILVDCSASMGAVDGGDSAYDRARRYAKQVAGGLAKDDRITLVRVTGRPEVIYRQFAPDAAGVKEGIENLALSPARANLFAALNAVFGDEKKRPSNPLVYFFTDCQASGWREIEQQRAAAERYLPKDTPFVLVDVGTRKEARPNLAVTGDPPPRQRAVAGLPVELRARVLNAAPVEAEATLTFSINDKPVERRPLKLPARKETVVRLADYFPAEEGVLRGKFTVEPADKSLDTFPEDNAYLFTLPVQSKVRVLVVNGAPSPASPHDDETIYLYAALTTEQKSGPAAPGADVVKILDVPPPEPETAFAGLDENALKAKLDKYHVVVLANCGLLHQVNPLAFAKLRDYVAEGGGLLVFPGDKVNPDVYNAALFQAPPPLKDQMTAARLGPAAGDPDRPETFVRLANDRFRHRLLSIFEETKKQDTRYFERVYVKRRFPLTVADPKRTAVVMEYRDGSPAIVESRFGEGRLVLSSFPVNSKWTNLPVAGAAEFVPLMLSMVRETRRRADAEGPTVVAADESAEFSVTNAWAPVTGSVTDARGRKRELDFERAGLRAAAVFDQTSESGFYTVAVRSGRDAAKSEELAFAVNLDPAESDTARVGPDRAKELLPTAKLTYEDRTAESLQEAPKDSRREWWREIIYVLFAVILAELLLATLRGSSKARADEAEA